MKLMNDNHNSGVLPLALSLLIGLLSAIGFWYFPLISDDLGSIAPVKPTYFDGEPVDFDVYFRWVRSVMESNHLRLGNLLMPFVILLPRWLPAAASGLAVAAIVYIGAKMCGSRLPRLLSAAIMATFIMVAYPWIDQLYLICFQVTYLWGAAVALVLVHDILYRRLPAAASAAIALLLGLACESYAGPVVGGVVCLMLFYKEYRTRRMVAILMALVVGLIFEAIPYIVFSNWLRWNFFSSRAYILHVFIAPAVAYAVAYLVLLPIYRKTIVNPADLLLLEIAIASACLTEYFATGPRVFGFGTICCAIGLTRLASIAFAGGRSTSLGAIVAGILFLFDICHLVAVDIMCRKLRIETDYVVEQFLTTGGRPVFAPMTLRYDAPLLTLQKPHYDWFAHSAPRAIFFFTYGRPDSEWLTVVPEELADFVPGDGCPIEGNPTMRTYRGYLIGTEATPEVMLADYGLGMKMFDFNKVAFLHGEDGETYCWMYPQNTVIDQFFSPVPLRVKAI